MIVKKFVAKTVTEDCTKFNGKKNILNMFYQIGLPLVGYLTMETKEDEGEKILWIEMKSSIFTFLAAESTFRKINSFVRQSGVEINRIVVTTSDEFKGKTKRPVLFNWVVNKNDRRDKIIHERHYISFCKYLWWDNYIPKILGKVSHKKKRLLNRILNDQTYHDMLIQVALKRLKKEYFVDSEVDEALVYTKIREEWKRRYQGKGLGNAVMYRWQALDIGTELGFISSDPNKHFAINLGMDKIPEDLFVRVMESVEQMEAGIIVSKTRKQDIVMRRHFLMYIIRKTTPNTLAYIGKLLGGRDHSTVIHGIEKVEERMRTSSVQKAVVDQFCILFDNIRIYCSNPDMRKIDRELNGDKD